MWLVFRGRGFFRGHFSCLPSRPSCTNIISDRRIGDAEYGGQGYVWCAIQQTDEVGVPRTTFFWRSDGIKRDRSKKTPIAMNDFGVLDSGLSKDRLRAVRLKVLAVALVSCLQPGVVAADPQHIDLVKGGTADVYFKVNITGKVYVSMGARPGESACAEFWWIKWPFGTVEPLGRHCGFSSFDIPGLTSFAFLAKLRAGGAINDVKLAVSATESVAHSATFEF